MIAFGCVVSHQEVYRRHAGAGIERAAEPDSIVYADSPAGPIARCYNLALDRAAALDGLEALVLLHEDAEIEDSGFCNRLRSVLSDPEVGIVGCIGAVGASTIAWWEASVTWDGFVRCSPELTADDLPELTWNGEHVPPYAPMGEVDTLDGFVLALSPWAVQNLRFDESLDPVYGYDFDFCLQVRASGRTVRAEHLGVTRHKPLPLVTDPEAWIEAHARTAEKWEGRMPHVPARRRDWQERARLAEAEAGVARLAGTSKLLLAYASADRHDAPLEELEASRSWRLTAPLRRVNARRRGEPGSITQHPPDPVNREGQAPPPPQA